MKLTNILDMTDEEILTSLSEEYGAELSELREILETDNAGVAHAIRESEANGCLLWTRFRLVSTFAGRSFFYNFMRRDR